MKIKFELPPAAANQSNGLAVRYATAKRSVPRWRWNLLLAAVLLVPAYFVARVAIATWWTSAPAVVVLEPLTVKAGAAGRVESIGAAGQQVRQGEAVASVRPQPAADAERPAPARATPAAAPTPTAQLAGARAALSLAQQQADLSRERLASIQALYADAAATAGELSNARSQLLQAQAAVAHAEADLEGLHVAASRPPAPAPEPARAAEASVAFAPSAPVAGSVLRPLVRVGDLVAPGTDLLQLVPDRPPVVRAYVEPSQSRYAEVGHRATLRFFDGTRIGASVVAIEPEAARVPSERVSPLAPATQSILVELAPDQPLPQRYRINQLPLDVRFDHVW
jgi:multidrug resistance efflux pump